MNALFCTLTDARDWVQLTPAEAASLEREGLAARCTEDCPAGTYHPTATWAEVGRATARLRLAEAS